MSFCLEKLDTYIYNGARTKPRQTKPRQDKSSTGQNLDTDKISTGTTPQQGQNLDRDKTSTDKTSKDKISTWTKPRHGQNLDTKIYLIKTSTIFFSIIVI